MSSSDPDYSDHATTDQAATDTTAESNNDDVAPGACGAVANINNNMIISSILDILKQGEQKIHIWNKFPIWVKR